MRRLVTGMAAFTLMGTGCATGTPVGARSSPLVVSSYRPFSRPAAPRAVPSSAPAVEPEEQKPEPVLTAESRKRAVALARALVGQRHVRIHGHTYQEDCTGLISGVLDQLGVNVLSEVASGDNAVTAIYRYAQNHGRIFDGGRPLPGDLVFFRETYDLNRDGHDNDGLTHIGIVEDVDADGTVTVIHRVARGVVRYRMNLANPDVRRDSKGKILNDYLREESPGRRQVLTGQLFAAYATIFPK